MYIRSYSGMPCDLEKLSDRKHLVTWKKKGSPGYCLGRWVTVKRSLRGQISDLRAGVGFVSLLWPKRAAHLKVVSVGRGGERPAFSGLRRQGAPLVPQVRATDSCPCWILPAPHRPGGGTRSWSPTPSWGLHYPALGAACPRCPDLEFL